MQLASLVTEARCLLSLLNNEDLLLLLSQKSTLWQRSINTAGEVNIKDSTYMMHVSGCLCSRLMAFFFFYISRPVLRQNPLNQPSRQWGNRKQQLTRILSSVLPFLVSSLMPRTNFIDDLSIIFLMLSVDDNINICYNIISLSVSVSERSKQPFVQIW